MLFSPVSNTLWCRIFLPLEFEDTTSILISYRYWKVSRFCCIYLYRFNIFNYLCTLLMNGQNINRYFLYPLWHAQLNQACIQGVREKIVQDCICYIDNYVSWCNYFLFTSNKGTFSLHNFFLRHPVHYKLCFEHDHVYMWFLNDNSQQMFDGYQ